MPTSEIQQLGRYQLETQLGSGAYASVYRAVDTTLQRAVALKILKPALLADEEALNRFLQEAQILANLLHPHIAWVWDVGEAEGKHFLAMRYVDGVSLDKLLVKQHSLPWAEALSAIEQVASALDFAHARGLIHRDVKPQNIISSQSEGAVLTDFGLAKAVQSSVLSTRSGAIIGTPQYIAPEIWKGEEASAATDQYALACVLFEMLTGQTLFDAPSPPAVMKKHFEPVNLPAGWPTGTPGSIGPVLQRALAREPQERFATILEFVAGLQAIDAEYRRQLEQQQAAQEHDRLLREAEHKLSGKDWHGVLVTLGRLRAASADDADLAALQSRLLSAMQTDMAATERR